MAQVEQVMLRRDPGSPPYAALRAFIASARKDASFSQQMLADRLGKPQSFVAKVERGERYLDVIEFVAIARILKFDVEEALTVISERL
jgi:ribosome-binding protein aMBF1 (putative translation factor)